MRGRLRKMFSEINGYGLSVIGALTFMGFALISVSVQAEGDGDLAGVYVGEQPGAYIQNQTSPKTAVLFSAQSVNSSYWVSADIKYYLGQYADSVYLSGGLTYAKEEGYSAEMIYRTGGGWEFSTKGRAVYGAGVTVWWNETWVEPIVRAGIYIAYYR